VYLAHRLTRDEGAAPGAAGASAAPATTAEATTVP
jgi:hypothetical protein